MRGQTITNKAIAGLRERKRPGATKLSWANAESQVVGAVRGAVKDAPRVKDMTKRLASNAEITRLINDRLKEGKELDGNCRDVEVSAVTPYRETDETRCNWNVDFYRGPVACAKVFRSIVDELRGQYNLKDD